MPRALLPFLEIHYERKGAGPPLLLLHDGASTARRDFDPVLPRLAEAFDVIAPDLRGHGESTPIGSGVRFQWPHVTRDAVDILDELGIESAHVAGVGDGATTALHLLIEAPKRVEGAVLAGARSYVPDEDIARLDALRPENVHAGAPALAADYAEWHGHGYWETLLDRYVASFRIDRAYLDVRHRLKQVERPVLLLHGTDDPLTPVTHAEPLADGIPEARLLLLEWGRRLPEAPQFAEVVAAFLGAIRAAPREEPKSNPIA